LIKLKEQPVSGKDLLLPGKVIELVQNKLGNPKIIKNKKSKDKFNSDTHTRCWKKYNVRPKSKSSKPVETNSKYCLYHEPTKQYLYTKDWVTFLVERMNNMEEYNSLYNSEI
jgi:hypothetical protein